MFPPELLGLRTSNLEELIFVVRDRSVLIVRWPSWISRSLMSTRSHVKGHWSISRHFLQTTWPPQNYMAYQLQTRYVSPLWSATEPCWLLRQPSWISQSLWSKRSLRSQVIGYFLDILFKNKWPIIVNLGTQHLLGEAQTYWLLGSHHGFQGHWGRNASS